MTRRYTDLRQICLVAMVLGAAVAYAQGLDPATMQNPGTDTWPTYYGDYTGRRHSSLSQINTQNAGLLTLAWAFQTRESNVSIKSSPLLIDGVLYFTIPDQLWAVDARSGRQLWHYVYPKSAGFYIGQRGAAAYRNWVYFLSNDCHLICLDARTGKICWMVEVADTKLGFFCTIAPQVVRNHLIIGVSGDFYDLNGYIRSYDPETGKQQWQWDSIPKPGQPGSETWPTIGNAIQHGGGMTWMSGTFDPELNLIFWGIGNPNPTMYGGDREGANLFTCSIVAIDPDSGKATWAFQASPHDVHDWDAVEDPVLVDAPFGGRPRKLLMQASRNGYFFVLDRTTGKALLSKPFTDINWSKGTDANGEPIRNSEKDPSAAGTLVSPASSGATNWKSPSFSPETGLFYVSTEQSFALFYHLTTGKAVGYAGKDFGVFMHSYLKAIDYKTGSARWTYDLGEGYAGAGVLTTMGNVLFTADAAGNLLLLNAENGETLWHAYAGGPVNDSPITYELDGQQYLLIGVEGVLYAWTLPQHVVQ